MVKEIQVIAEGALPNVIKEALRIELRGQGDVKIDVRRFRALETEIVVAIVGIAGIALQALLQAVFKIAEKRNSQKIVIQGSSGRRIEVPVGVLKEDLEEYIKLAKEIDVALIKIEASR